MALAKHGITENTPKNIPLGAGTWFKGLTYSSAPTEGWSGTVLGATSGGSKITIAPEILDIEIDGALAVAKGLAVMQGGTAEAEVNFAELNADIIKMTMLAEELEETDAAVAGGFDGFQTKGTINTGDYVENLGFVGYTADGSNQIIVIFDNALCTSGFAMEPKNKENAVVTATFRAYGDIDSDLDRVPVRIYYPTPTA